MAISTQDQGVISKIFSSISTEAARKDQLDVRLHFVPLNLKALEVGLGDRLVFTDEELRDAYKAALDAIDQPLTAAELRTLPSDPNKRKKEEQNILKQRALELNKFVFNFNDLRDRIVTFITSTHKNRVIIINGKFYAGVGVKTPLTQIELRELTPCVVYEGGFAKEDIIGAMYGGYGSAQKGLFTNFLNKELKRFVNTKFYEGTEYTPGFDVGHILGNTSLAQTALGQKIQNSYDTLQNLIGEGSITGTQAAIVRSGIDRAFNDLRERSTYGSPIELTLTQDTRDALESVQALVVIVQERVENQKLYGSQVEGPIGGTLARFFTNLGFSNSLKEAIELKLVETLKFGKAKTRGVRKPPTKITVPGKKGVRGVKTQRSVERNVRSTVPSRKPLPKPTVPAYDPQLDLFSLQTFINTHLQDVISANMGDGSSKTVLNYRTGRFASSAKVESLSESRNGMITAFYSYMKNPYATFSDGGRQSSPKSRDPKLLISKSIREIAAEKVANRLRAVAV